MAHAASGEPEDQLADVVGLMLDFLVSKSLVASERTLRNELQLLVTSSENGSNGQLSQATAKWKHTVRAHNVYTSELERRLGMEIPLRPGSSDPFTPVVDVTPKGAACVSVNDEASAEVVRPPLPPTTSTIQHIQHVDHVPVSDVDDAKLRTRRGQGTPQQRVVFHDPLQMSKETAETLAHISLPLLYNPHVNGLEDQPELSLPVGALIAGRYRVAANIGKGSFSKVYQCHDLHCRRMVSVKVLRNDKDCLDAGLGEVRVLALIARQDPEGAHKLLRLLDYFYFREHLIIVTELLRDSLFSFYRYLQSTGRRLDYFTSPVLASLSSQLLSALAFLHDNGLAHCDVKPENVCVVSASRHIFKLIDFGSSVFQYDCHNSYVQSRWYRAPEVMLGMLWDGKVDLWSFGCLLAELVLGTPIFHASTVEMVLAAHVAVLGAMPSYMVRRQPETARMFFTSSGTAYQVDPPGMRCGSYLLYPREHSGLARLIEKNLDDPGFISLLAALLTIDPSKRPTAYEVLQHPWLGSQLHTSTASEGDSNHRTEFVHSFTAGVLADYDSTASDGYLSDAMMSHGGSFSDGAHSPAGSRSASPQ